MAVRDACPECGSIQFKKNGHIHSGKQNHRCKTCGRQFVAIAEDRIIADEQRTLVEHLLVSASPCAGSVGWWVSVSHGSCTLW
jgi:ribosomal protein S27AE